MSSEKDFREAVQKVMANQARALAGTTFDVFFRPNLETIQLFRHGGFATIDEFSKLAGSKLSNEIQKLKGLLALGLSIKKSRG
jgi:hypothetical protein